MMRGIGNSRSISVNGVLVRSDEGSKVGQLAARDGAGIKIAK